MKLKPRTVKFKVMFSVENHAWITINNYLGGTAKLLEVTEKIISQIPKVIAPNNCQLSFTYDI